MSNDRNFPWLHGALRAVAVLLAAAAFATGASGQSSITEGKEYAKLKNAMPVETGKNIEVLEFFSYGCPHCGELEPILQAWLKNKPADVTFRRIPVMFQPKWEMLAKIYYALEAEGDESKYAPEIFTALHGKGMNFSDEKVFLDWAASKGLDRNKMKDLLNSFAVVGKVNRAKQMAGAYGIQSVPTIIVDGKYTTGPERVPNGHAGVPNVIDALILKARAERPKS